MKLFKLKTTLSTCLQLSCGLSLLISPVSIFSFSDMNDSTTQEETVKILQKRVDSLELRFEKSEIEKNQAKQSVFDWNRGMYSNVSFDINNFNFKGVTSLGYMFCKMRKNNRKEIITPLIRLGVLQLEMINSKSLLRQEERFFTSIGYQRLRQTTERVSFFNGIYLNIVPDFKNHELSGAGLEYANSLDFWYSQSSALGIGIWVRGTAILGEYNTWYKTSGFNYSSGARITFTQCFLKHNVNHRSK